MKNKNLVNIEFGKRISHLRNKYGLSQEVLADKCNLNRTYIGAIERGEKSPTIITISKIAKGFNLTLKDIFDYEK